MPNLGKSRQNRASRASPRASDLHHDRLEAQREALLHRLERLDDIAKNSRGYRSTMTLLNSKYRKASRAARLGILQAATFMTEVLEMLPFV
ncbi:MAG: hypothetical protein ACKVP3_15420 [Hyphomicrobiaceae bacterium]